MKDNIINNLALIHQRIHQACLDSHRDPKEIKLLLATKTVSPDNIQIALQNGEYLIGENKVQELRDKYTALQQIEHETHFIGYLQTNKIKDVIKYADCIQSLDRIELAEKLNQRLEFENKTINVLIQVNTSHEESKFGIHPDQALELITYVSQYPRLKIKGLMTIGLFSSEIEKVRACFKILKQIQIDAIALNLPNVSMQALSMGMSGDIEVAIAEGATILRVGTAIFGKRILPDSYYWNQNTE